MGKFRTMILAALALVGVSLAAACGGETKTANANNPYEVDESQIKKGVAPQTVERFKTLAREGFYNGTAFHRVNGSVGLIQGGDPLSKDDDPDNDGTGDSPYPDLPPEFSDVPYERGSVGAARTDYVNSANCQFFVALKRISEWDKRYAVFGKVIRGLDTASIISTAPVRPGTESPDPKVVIKSVTLQPRANF